MGALLDKGGARMREREDRAHQADLRRRIAEIASRPITIQPESVTMQQGKFVVVMKVHETHDGEDCGCIDTEMTLHVGDTIELTHECHDGRVDKVIGTVQAVDFVPDESGEIVVEHGTAVVR